MISVKDFGALGDGTTNDTAALNTAFSQVGRSIYIPKGCYLHDQLDPPVCAQIIGESEYCAILKPRAGVAIGLSIAGGEHYPAKLASFQIDGSLTSGTIGLFLGQASSAVQADGVRVLNFKGTDAVGVRVGDLLKSTIRKLTAQCNTLNLHVEQVVDLFPTTLHFDSCVFADACTHGAKLVDGWNILFTNCDFESSALEGTLLAPRDQGNLDQIVFDSCWWEKNYFSHPDRYQFVAGDGTPRAGAVIHATLRNPRFSTDTNSAKAVHMNGPAVQGFVITNPTIYSAVNGAISIENGAFGEINEWQVIRGMLFDSVVHDPDNKCASSGSAGFRSWTPTFSVPGAGPAGIASSTVAIADYRLEGAKTMLQLDFTVVLASTAPPTAVVATLPPGLTPAQSAVCFGFVMEDSGSGPAYAPGVLAAFTDGKLYARKADNAAFAAGATVNFRGVVIYEN